jgi:PAS domain S-box-containing protein
MVGDDVLARAAVFAGPSAATEAQHRLADALPILVMISGADGVVQFFNRRWYELTGQQPFERDEADDWQSYMHPDDGPAVQQAWYKAVSRGERQVFMRYRLRDRASGEYRWFSAQAVAVEDSGGAIAQWIGAAVDVHDQVTAHDALAKNLAEQTRVAEIYQRASLARALPSTPGVAFDVEYRASTDAGRVGGDWYDVTVLGDGRVLFSIGDVTGHGVAAAVEMGRARQSILSAAADVPEPAEILRRVNRVMCLQQSMATALVGVVDVASRSVVLASAGHPRAIRAEASGRAREIITAGVALGVMDEIACEQVTLALREGDTLIAYTDGLVEFARDTPAAERRLTETLENDRGPLEGYAARVRAAVIGEAPAPDDVAILALRLTA